MTLPLTEESVREFAVKWVGALDRHVDYEVLRRFVVDEGLEMNMPEGTFRELDGLAKWYDDALHLFFDEHHRFIDVRSTITGDTATVKIMVNWQSRAWKPPAAASVWLNLDIEQEWTLVAGENGPLIKTYTVGIIDPRPDSGTL
jgi:hypothetical protein